jgi:16S rRNA processing protein RimM
VGGTLPDEYLSLGVVVRPHGLKGEVKVRLTCEGVDRLLDCRALLLVRADGTATPATVVKSVVHSDGDVLVRLKEVEGREASEALRGAYLAVREKEAEPLKPGQYRRHELLGLTVETTEGRSLGTVEDLLEMPAQWVLVVRGVGGNEILLPAHPALVKLVDLKARRLVVDFSGEVFE